MVKHTASQNYWRMWDGYEYHIEVPMYQYRSTIVPSGEEHLLASTPLRLQNEDSTSTEGIQRQQKMFRIKSKTKKVSHQCEAVNTKTRT